MTYVLVIARHRLTRSLIGAQLKEEGFEVMGFATIMEAAFQLTELGVRPDLLIVDTLEQALDQKTIDLLGKVCPETPLILIHGACDYPSQLKWQAKRYKLAKPVTIGQIVGKVKELNVDNQSHQFGVDEI